MQQSTLTSMMMEVKQATGMKIRYFSLKYLGCPLSYSKRNKKNYSELIDKVQNKLKKMKR